MDKIPNVEINKANKLWKDERPMFGCSMGQLSTFLKGENLQDKLQAYIEWLKRYDHAFPRYSKDRSFNE